MDSIQKSELEEKLKALKTTDNLQKQDLQNQLNAIEQRAKDRITQKKADIDAIRATAKSYAVLNSFNDTLFFIYNKIGSVSAKDRATSITNRINKLSKNVFFSADSLKAIASESYIDIIYDDEIIISISESDALWNNKSASELGVDYIKIIAGEVEKYKKETSVVTIAKEIGLALLVIFLLWIALKYIIRLFKYFSNKVLEQEGKLIQGIKLKNYVLFNEKQQVNVLLKLNSLLKWVLILVVVYITLPILFGIFPWTKNFAETLFGFIINPLKNITFKLWHFLPNLITIIVIVVVFRYLLRGVQFLKTEIENGALEVPGFYADWANPTYQIVRVLIYAFMIVVIFPYLPGSDSPVFQGVSVFLGFLFTFGSAGSLSNVIAGLVLTYMRLFKLGDRVKIGDVVGDVIEKSLLVTRIRTIKNEIISIPNSTVMSSHTINYSSEAPDKGLIIHTTVTIGYDVPWKQMHQALIDAALRTDMILKDPKPFVLQTSLDDFYVSYQCNAYIKEANKQALIYSNLHQNIQDVCNEVGIEILSPHYRAMRDGNQVTIPSNYLETDYQVPSFNVKVKSDS